MNETEQEHLKNLESWVIADETFPNLINSIQWILQNREGQRQEIISLRKTVVAQSGELESIRLESYRRVTSIPTRRHSDEAWRRKVEKLEAKITELTDSNRLKSTQCCDPVIDSQIGAANKRIAELEAEVGGLKLWAKSATAGIEQDAKKIELQAKDAVFFAQCIIVRDKQIKEQAARIAEQDENIRLLREALTPFVSDDGAFADLYRYLKSVDHIHVFGRITHASQIWDLREDARAALAWKGYQG